MAEPAEPEPSNIDTLLKAREEIDAQLRRHRAEVTILFTDVVGSTALFHGLGDAAGLLLNHRHESLAKKAIDANGGSVLKTIGDSVMALFPDPAGAVRAAVEIQLAVCKLNPDLPEQERLSLRIGINSGKAFLSKDDVIGDVVNVAARVTKHCGPDQILISSTVREALREIPGLRVRALGEAEFHGKPEKAPVFEIIWDRRAPPEPVIPQPLRAPDTQPPRRRRWVYTGILAGILAAALAGGLYVLLKTILSRRERPILILLADFENSTGKKDFDGLREMFASSLQQSRRVNLFGPERVAEARDRMKSDPDAPTDEKLGIEICRREGIARLLLGTIRKSGNTFQISVRGLKPDDGSQLFDKTVQFSAEGEVFNRIDNLASQVREALGESSRQIWETSRPLAQVSTPSLPALEQYSKAMQAVAHGEDKQVPGLLKSAVELDPNFAMAHLRLARYYSVVGGNDIAAKVELERAYELREGLTQREQWLIEGYYHALSQDYEKTLDSFEKLVSLYPGDPDAHIELAAAHDNAGHIEEAITEFRQVLTLNPPEAGRVYQQLALRLARVSRNDEALKTVKEAEQHGYGLPKLHWSKGFALLGKGDVNQARIQFSDLRNSELENRSLGDLLLATAGFYEGKFDEAVSLLKDSLLEDKKSKNEGYELVKRYYLARAYLLRGDREEAQKEAVEMASLRSPAVQAEDLRRTGFIWIELGDSGRAEDTVKRLEDMAGAGRSDFRTSCLENLKGEIALAKNDPGQAEAAFKQAWAAYPRFVSHRGLARSHELNGDWQKAKAEWEIVLKSSGEILQKEFPADLVLANLEFAKVFRQMNDIKGAQRFEDTVFHKLWAAADPVVLEQVRKKFGIAITKKSR